MRNKTSKKWLFQFRVRCLRPLSHPSDLLSSHCREAFSALNRPHSTRKQRQLLCTTNGARQGDSKTKQPEVSREAEEQSGKTFPRERRKNFRGQRCFLDAATPIPLA